MNLLFTLLIFVAILISIFTIGFLAPVPGADQFRFLSGGLRYAATTGYYLTAFQAETHSPRGGTDVKGPQPS